MNPLANTTSEPASSVILDSGMTETIEHTLSSSEQFAHHKNINNYYDSPAVAFFEQLAQQQIHLGYWDDKYPNVSFANAAKRAVEAGMGAAVLSSLVAAGGVRAGKLSTLELALPPRPFFSLCHRGRHLSHAGQAFLEMLGAEI